MVVQLVPEVRMKHDTHQGCNNRELLHAGVSTESLPLTPTLGSNHPGTDNLHLCEYKLTAVDHVFHERFELYQT